MDKYQRLPTDFLKAQQAVITTELTKRNVDATVGEMQLLLRTADEQLGDLQSELHTIMQDIAEIRREQEALLDDAGGVTDRGQ